MDYQNHNTGLRKNKHLNFKERITIELRLKDGFSAYRITKELKRPINKIASKTAEAVTEVLNRIRNIYGDKFSDIFKTITSDNGSEFANLSTLEAETDTKVYFTHPYSSFEKGTNERHNGLIRRFIPKGKRISDYICYCNLSI